MARQDTIDRLRSSLERTARRRPSMPPPQVLVVAPGLDFEHGGAQPFHAASVGKVMTATLVGMLAEQGALGFDTPVGKLLPAGDLDGLPVAAGSDFGADVAVEHLLTHTSGLPDYFEPRRSAETAYSIEVTAGRPDRRWTPSDLLDEARDHAAIGRPGERFCYGDPGFVLLGRIVEEATGERFNAVLRKRVLGPSGMERASTPYSDARTPDDLAGLDVAPFWIGDHELSRALSVSLDWAGGGVVAPPADLVRFQEALHGGRLVSPDLLRRMTTPA